MATNTGTTRFIGTKRRLTVTQATGATATNESSLFGDSQSKPESTSTRTKRKITDPYIQIVTIDRLYDLTLVVGNPEHLSGQKAYRVSKSSFRHASDVWGAMLSGRWPESGMSEISFPEDPCHAFHIVLRIAHWQFQELPAELTQKELVEIAMLADKYNLRQLLLAAADSKRWLEPYKRSNELWATVVNLQDFALIATTFGHDVDYQYMVNKLAMRVQIKDGVCYYFSNEKVKIYIRSDLPPYILGK
jgi:hypothetical protein